MIKVGNTHLMGEWRASCPPSYSTNRSKRSIKSKENTRALNSLQRLIVEIRTADQQQLLTTKGQGDDRFVPFSYKSLCQQHGIVGLCVGALLLKSL